MLRKIICRVVLISGLFSLGLSHVMANEVKQSRPSAIDQSRSGNSWELLL
ncbi:MAG: hypothetical protein WCG04_06595 [Alphaproteobacteria bacterium]